VATAAVALGAICARAAAGAGWVAVLAPALLFVAAARATLRPLALGVLLGLVLGRGATPGRPPSLEPARLPGLRAVEGTVGRTELPARGLWRFTLHADAVGQPSRRLARSVPVAMRLRLHGGRRSRTAGLASGARIQALARFEMRRGRLTAFVHDRRALTVLTSGSAWATAIQARRRAASRRLRAGLPRRDAGLAQALLLGDRTRLDRRDRALFRGTGQAHLLAVSGLHVGLLLGGLFLLLRLLGARPHVAWIAGLLAAAVYVPVTGSQPSAIRAGLGTALWCGARLLRRRPSGLAILALVGLLVLWTRPAAVAEVSFQLSFAAVASILFLGGRVREMLVPPRPILPGLLPPKRAPVRTALAISIAAWLGTAPLVAAHIGRLCPAGPLIALFALPLAAVLLGAGVAFFLAAPIPALAALPAALFVHAAGALRGVLDLARRVHLEARPVATPSALWWVLYAAAIFALARGPARVRRWSGLSLVLLLGMLSCTGGLAPLSTMRTESPMGTEAREEYHADDVDLALPHLALALPEPAASAGVAAGLLLFALLSVRLSWLSARGAAAAGGLGLLAFVVYRGSGLAALVAPFLVATLLGKLPGAERAGARSLRQVLCNGMPAFLGCLLTVSGRPDLGGAFFLGALACLGGDSCATEIGVRFGGQPFRLAGRGPIRSGESGGVTLAGLVAALLGAALAPCAFAWGSGMPLAWAGLLSGAGLAGALLDSVLGGWLQYRGRDPDADRTTERPRVGGVATVRVSGWRWLDNDAVNLLTGLLAGLVAIAAVALA